MSDEEEGEGKSRGDRLKGIAARVVQFGGAFRKRHTVFADTLALLRDMDLITEEQQQRLEGIWQAGDDAARAAVEGLVGKVANLDFSGIDIGGLKALGLQKAAEAIAPTVEKLRAGELERLLMRYVDPVWIDAVLDRATAMTRQTLISLMAGGLVLLATAVLAYLYPDVALRYGIPALLVVIAGAMWYAAWSIKRALRTLDLDLTALSHLHPHERRAIIVSRLAHKTQQTEKIKQGLDWLSEKLDSEGVESKSGAPGAR